MLKHKGFPGRMASSDYQFTIRRPAKDRPTELKERERYRDRRPADKRADEAFLFALWEHFGTEPFARGNLDAGRLNWLFGREVIPADDPFDPQSYDALLQIDVEAAAVTFPGLIEVTD